jgi:hypothetical protein
MPATAPPLTRRDLETQLIEKAWKDPAFRKDIISDPRGMFEKYLGRNLPEQVKVFVHEEDANTLRLSIPAAPGNLSELSDEDLERVAGGTEMLLATVVLSALGVAVTGAAAAGIGGAVTQSQGW